MGCCGSKHDREERYIAKHHIPRDEISKKHLADSLKAGSNRSSGSGKNLAPPEATSPRPAAVAPAENPRPQVNNYKPKKPKLDIKDFQFLNLKGEVKVKPPGSINGQAFVIDTCEDCDLYVIDACAQVTIDKAKNCRIFLGPTEGSVFIRDSTNCKFAVICRQLRTRDCVNVDIGLFCRTRPIVESSTNVGFFCYDLNYEALPSQLKAVKLSPLHNFWSHVYDFTPKEGSWKLLPPESSVPSLLAPIPAEAAAAFGRHGVEGPLLVTWGDRAPAPSPDYLFVIFPQKEDQALQFAVEAKQKAVILRANKVVVSSEQASEMARAAGWARNVEREISNGACVGFEFSGPGCGAALRGAAQALGGHHTDVEAVGALFRYLGIEN